MAQSCLKLVCGGLGFSRVAEFPGPKKVDRCMIIGLYIPQKVKSKSLAMIHPSVIA